MDLGPAGYKGKEEEKMKRVIITGATGAVGTAIIRELIKNNFKVKTNLKIKAVIRQLLFWM